MTHDEFVAMYNDALRHGWVTSKDPSKASQQKKREKEYNADYYRKHSDKWRKKYMHKSDFDKDSQFYKTKRMNEDDALTNLGLYTNLGEDPYGWMRQRYLTADDIRDYLNGKSDIENIRDSNGRILDKSSVQNMYDSTLRRVNNYNNPSKLASEAKDKASRQARDLRQGIKSREEYINAIGGIAKLETKLDEISVAVKRKAKQFIKKLLG